MKPTAGSSLANDRLRTKRLRLVMAFALASFATFSGCTRNSPRGVAQRYLDNLQQFNYADCYGMLSARDKKDRDFSEFLTGIPMAPDTSPLWFRAVLHTTHYELGDTRRSGDSAVVPVKVTTPNLPLWERTLDAAAGPDHIGAEEAARSLDTGDYPKLTYSDQVVLTKEHHRWRVVAAFGMRDHLMDGYREAVARYNRNDFAGASAAYQALLRQADQLNATGTGQMKAAYSAELGQIQAIQRDRPVSGAYIASKLKLRDVTMKMSEDRVPGIFGVVTNAGGRALDQVELAVTWYEGRGNSLRSVSREKHAIVITPLQFTDFSRAVVPFLPGASRSFGFILNAPAEVQQAASPYVTVSAIVFTHSPAPLPRPAQAAAAAPPTPAPPKPAVGPSRPHVAAPPGVAAATPAASTMPSPRPAMGGAPAPAARPQAQP